VYAQLTFAEKKQVLLRKLAGHPFTVTNQKAEMIFMAYSYAMVERLA
jgi:hypothetical protein